MTLSTKVLIGLTLAAIIFAVGFWISLPQDYKDFCQTKPSILMRNEERRGDVYKFHNFQGHRHTGGAIGFFFVTGGAVYLAHRKEGGKK